MALLPREWANNAGLGAAQAHYSTSRVNGRFLRTNFHEDLHRAVFSRTFLSGTFFICVLSAESPAAKSHDALFLLLGPS